MRITGPTGLDADVIWLDADGNVTEDPAEAGVGRDHRNRRTRQIRRTYFTTAPADEGD
jgi:hypothetical protein